MEHESGSTDAVINCSFS